MELLRGDRPVVRVGHRGAAALAPENSLEAIEAGAANGADVVELDVVRGAGGALVLAHGPHVPAGAAGLEDALSLVASTGIAVQLDVKTDGLAADAVAALARHGLLGRSFVSSYSLPILRGFAAAAPELPRSLTYPEDRHGVSDNPFLRPAVRPGLALLRALLPIRLPPLLRAAGARAATLNYAVVSRRIVELCHGAGIAVYAWTVNEATLAATLVETGLDGIISDDPRLLRPGTHFT
jgi:glycerophosphoryl diester phosphodiesterase